MAGQTGLRWLTVGLEAPLGSAEAMRAGAHLTAFLLPEQQMGGREAGPIVAAGVTGSSATGATRETATDMAPQTR